MKSNNQEKSLAVLSLRAGIVTVLVLVALILFICVITGGREEPQQDTAQTEKTSRYEKAYLCADSPSVSYLNDDLEPAGTAVRGSAVTVSSEHTRKKEAYERDIPHSYAFYFFLVIPLPSPAQCH